MTLLFHLRGLSSPMLHPCTAPAATTCTVRTRPNDLSVCQCSHHRTLSLHLEQSESADLITLVKLYGGCAKYLDEKSLGTLARQTSPPQGPIAVMLRYGQPGWWKSPTGLRSRHQQ